MFVISGGRIFLSFRTFCGSPRIRVDHGPDGLGLEAGRSFHQRRPERHLDRALLASQESGRERVVSGDRSDDLQVGSG